MTSHDCLREVLQCWREIFSRARFLPVLLRSHGESIPSQTLSTILKGDIKNEGMYSLIATLESFFVFMPGT